jgi:hypothetical protein
VAPTSSALAAPDAAPGGVYWNGDFGNGAGFSQWHHVHDGAENPINGRTSAQLVSTPGSSGNSSVSLVARGGTGTSSDRAEVGNDPSTNRGYEGQESYYHFSVYFPSSNKGNWAPKVWDHNNFFQFIGTDWAKPVMNMGIDTGDFGTDSPHMYFNFNVGANGDIDDHKGGRWDLGEVRYESWTDFVVHVRWSKDTSGLLQAWMNGNEVVPLRGARTLGNAPVIMEIQNYRPATGGSTTAHLFDAIRIGDSFGAVQ